MKTIFSEKLYDKNKIELLGTKFYTGNGYFGYRGTLDEYSAENLVALTLSEIFDDSGNGWREPVNMPNPGHIYVVIDGKKLNPFDTKIKEHYHELDINGGIQSRTTTFSLNDGLEVTIHSERYASIVDYHNFEIQYEVFSNQPINIDLVSAIDTDVWNINGNHFKQVDVFDEDEISVLTITTKSEEKLVSMGIKEKIYTKNKPTKIKKSDLHTTYSINLKENQTVTLRKEIAIYKETDSIDTAKDVIVNLQKEKGSYQERKELQIKSWKQRYNNAGITLTGDDKILSAIYYNIYSLLSSSPFHTDQVSIPARGLTGQVYKGSMFWDTEVFMLQELVHTEPIVAKNVTMYRVHRLNGAKEKAKEYGFNGAFYQWESQEIDADACTLHNLTDIFTGRKVRTFFRDRQIHISADVAYGIWKYFEVTGDVDILLKGGAEVILECARFYYSCAYFKKDKNRYEFLDVTGADEYHERVNNDAYTNYMIKHNAKLALKIINLMQSKFPDEYESLMNNINYWEDIGHIEDLYEKIYLPPINEDGVIEQFDGYFNQEDITLEELYSRIIKENEYLGSPTGLAVETQIIKQADITLLMTLLPDEFKTAVKKANLDYYDIRTEHGSSHSAPIYGLLAAQVNDMELAYKYLKRSAFLDLEGNYKLYLGDLYIGGAHTGCNAAVWRMVVEGFGGLSTTESEVFITPHLPDHWQNLSYRFLYKGDQFYVEIDNDKKYIQISHTNNCGEDKIDVIINNNPYSIGKEPMKLKYGGV